MDDNNEIYFYSLTKEKYKKLLANMLKIVMGNDPNSKRVSPIVKQGFLSSRPYNKYFNDTMIKE